MSPPTGPRPAAPSRRPSGLTLLVGSEEYLIARATRSVVAAAQALAPGLERRDVDVEEPAAVGDLQAALSPSLFGEAAVVVLSDIGEAGPAVVDALVGGLADLAEDTWVVVAHGGVKAKPVLTRLRECRPPGGVTEIACAKVTRPAQRRELLQEQARAAGRELSSDGADALALAVGSDIALLVGALEQVLADTPDDPIDAAAISEMFAGVAEVSGFQLADAVWERHSLLALSRLRWGMASQTLTGPGVTGSLAAGLRGLVRVDGAPRGLAKEEVARRAGVPPFKVAQLRQTAQAWEKVELGDAVIALAEVDAAVKGGLLPGESLEAAQKEHALESFITRTAGPADRPGRPRRT